ncbi:MAG: hypothetical protein O7167_01975 [Wolbachia endosymbiont of Andrena nigroaenea]|uniref:hypothetical protein n=1 Tax=Wolbachia endosymbiont (group A) of Andrena hattorfiana TaxID=2953977 RepID=UPI0021F89D56|nr:hypothetical protein [Wolbachia endosymbiont (group A) of Andrena hattorfiana]MDX5526640.1 hypothetical protein [Wolbachia endosymbiont of Andrena nigroaenea]
MCDNAIESFQNFQRETGLSDITALKTVIQEMEEHRRVMGLNIELRHVIKSLNVNQVKAALENYGEDVKSVLEREVDWNDGDVDPLLVYPLIVDYERNLDKEELKKI